MTLEEHIQRYDDRAKSIRNAIVDKKESQEVVELLRELQKWRGLRDAINMLCVVDCEYPLYRKSKTMCDACPIGTVKEYFEQIFGEEVKDDDT